VDAQFDRNKILVTVHPRREDVWYWLIPFAGGRCSLGVVARKEFFAAYAGTADERLRQIVAEDPGLTRLLANADWDTPARELGGYAADVVAMHGPGFALLGNAAEFLDPVFSSGVTIAMRSASMAARCVQRQLAGEAVDWASEFEQPLRRGVDCFRAFVEAWYDGRFQTIIFSEKKSPELRRMISSVLAGYAWDETNPFVSAPRRRLDVVAQLCAQ
jgi:flavin-dependent dehydrogenase